MKFSALSYFLVVAKELNISKASQKLYLTQQSLSEQITRLESEYQVRLFDRRPRLHLTYAGQKMVEFAEQVLKLERQFKNELADISMENSGALSVGVRGTHSRILLPQLLPVYMESHPNIRLKISTNVSRELAQMLDSGQIDIAIASARLMNNPNFISKPLPSDNYYFIIPENLLEKYFGLTGKEALQSTELDYSRLNEVPFILLEEDSITRVAANHFLAEHGVTAPNVLMECRNSENALLACSRGLGIVFALGSVYRHFVYNSRQFYPLYGFPFESPTVDPLCVICYHRNRPLSRAGQDFVDLTQKIYAETLELNFRFGEMPQDKTC